MTRCMLGKVRRVSDRVSTWLLTLTNPKLAMLIVSIAVVLSLLTVLVLDIVWDGRIHPEHQLAAIVTPLPVGLAIVVLFLLLLERLRNENRCRLKTEQRLEEAQYLAHLGNWELDLEGDALYWSDEIYRIFEIDPKRFSASYKGFLQRVHPDDRAKVDRAYRDSLNSDGVYEITHRLLMDDGRIKYVHEHGRSDFDADGRAVRSIGTVQDVTERIELQQELHRLATTDMLTGINNRHWLDEQLKREVINSRRYGAPLSIIMFDVDNFKSVNDTYGHELGDKVLIHVAKVTKELIRTSDLFARWGGEEFMVLCSHSPIDGANLLAERIRKTLANATCHCCKNLSITASFGVASYQGQEDLEHFLKRADDALYEAKHSGKNRVVADMGDDRGMSLENMQTEEVGGL